MRDGDEGLHRMEDELRTAAIENAHRTTVRDPDDLGYAYDGATHEIFPAWTEIEPPGLSLLDSLDPTVEAVGEAAHQKLAIHWPHDEQCLGASSGRTYPFCRYFSCRFLAASNFPFLRCSES